MKIARFTSTILIVAALLIAPKIAYPLDPQDDVAFACASAVNVVDCMDRVDITSLPVSSQLLGFTGPLTAAIRYDNYLAWILDVGYAQSFYSAAAAFKLSAGLNERRTNVSLGYTITPKQQIKLTYEYLAQNLPFDYTSGTVNEWVNQHAFGAAYHYIVGHDILKSLELYGTYTKAASKALFDIEMYTDDVLTQINRRRIAGGTEKTAGGAMTVTPLQNTQIKLGAGYSALHFDTQWEDDETSAAIAYHAEVRQLLTPHILVSAGIGHTISGNTYTTRVSRIMPWNVEAALIGQYIDTTGGIPGATTLTASLSYPAPKMYQNVVTASLGAIKHWVTKPVVYNTRVLATAEERILEAQITTHPIPNVAIPVGERLNPPITMSDYFNYHESMFDKIQYTIHSVIQMNNNQPAHTHLNLVIMPIDNDNAILTLSAPPTEAMMHPGQYQAFIQARGYRDGQVISQIKNQVVITITTNSDLPTASWHTQVTLPPAIAGTTDYTLDLAKLVKGNQQIGETFKFTLVNPQPWMTLSADTQRLIVADNKEVPNIQGDETITLSAISQTSGKQVGGGNSPNYTIQIKKKGSNAEFVKYEFST